MRQNILGIILITSAAFLVLWQVPVVRAVALVAYEDVALAVAPSAERAYEYGNRHLDATRYPANYDIERSMRLYERANELNAQLPYLQHQRARAAFLKGDFLAALTHINVELAQNQSPSPSSYYVRGLIKGYTGDYEGAAGDYEEYLKTDPNNWAAINDYAWVLLKSARSRDALVAVDWGLITWPDNPWLLNSKATAHFELEQLGLAQEAVAAAAAAVAHVTEADWLRAYPGNDPRIASQGVQAFQKAVAENMHTISLALQQQGE